MIHSSGQIAVGDQGNNRIQVFNPDGSYVRHWGSFGDGDLQFRQLTDLALYGDFYLYN